MHTTRQFKSKIRYCLLHNEAEAIPNGLLKSVRGQFVNFGLRQGLVRLHIIRTAWYKLIPLPYRRAQICPKVQQLTLGHGRT